MTCLSHTVNGRPGIGTQQPGFIAQGLYSCTLLFFFHSAPQCKQQLNTQMWIPKGSHSYEKSREWKVHSYLIRWHWKEDMFQKTNRVQHDLLKPNFTMIVSSSWGYSQARSWWFRAVLAMFTIKGAAELVLRTLFVSSTNGDFRFVSELQVLSFISLSVRQCIILPPSCSFSICMDKSIKSLSTVHRQSIGLTFCSEKWCLTRNHMAVGRGSDLQADQYFLRKITSGHSNIWQGATIYYLGTLSSYWTSESQFIDLLSKDNDIYLAGFWWGLKLVNNVFNC